MNQTTTEPHTFFTPWTMWPLRSSIEYKAIPNDDEWTGGDVYAKAEKTEPRRAESQSSYPGLIATIAFLILLSIGAFLVSPSDLQLYDAFIPGTEDVWRPAASPVAQLTPPAGCAKRHEWRTLSSTEQQAYISAVLCLRDGPSALAPTSNRTSYDDFPWIHSRVGYFTHNSAPFLPWHRYFLHVYETTLREECGYEGGLVYWDWTQDAEALERSPVFDAESGFGGDGEVGGEVTVGKSGRCVVDGPFAGVTADYYDVEYGPHCLSRGFRNDEGESGHIDGHDLRPDSIEEVLSQDKYEDFVRLMESRVHDAIPFGIAGDFETFTAPYGMYCSASRRAVKSADVRIDPLFFLHHTQLDRLWWLWQQRQPGQGLEAYGGHKQRHSMEMADLEDALHMKGLAVDVQVADVMDVEGDLLCYTY